GLSTLGFDAGRFPPTPPACYRASWQLPGPDLHRLADTSYAAWIHLRRTTSFRTRHVPTPAGHTKLRLGSYQGVIEGGVRLRACHIRPVWAAPIEVWHPSPLLS